MKKSRRHTGRKGAAYVLAIVLLVSFMAMASAFAVFTNVNVRVSKNAVDVHRAQLAAESGMAFAIPQIRPLVLPNATDDDTVIVNVAQALSERLAGSENLGGGAVTAEGSVVSVPQIMTDDGSFEIRIVQRADKTLYLEVRGWANGVRRTVAMDLTVVLGHPNSVFNYGLASRGSISITGNGKIRGENELTDATVVSASESEPAVSLSGNAVVEGDISTVGNSVDIGPNVTVAGQTGDGIDQHIHFGVEAPVFPEVDTSIFLPLATGDVVDQNTDTSSSGTVFENIIIRAGSNPTFASDVIINGIIFIESPNVVNFSGKVTLNGLIATEDADDPIENCKISFEGQVEAYGVDVLPDEPQFADIKETTGTFIVAPGFDVSFAGQFTTINGTVAADKLSFSGQAEGTINGSVIGLADYPTTVSGQVDIVVDRSGAGEDPPDAGFLLPKSLEVVQRSYQETSQ